MASLELRSLRSVSPLTSHYEELPNPGQGKSSGVTVEEQDNTTTAPYTGYRRSVVDPQPRKKSFYNRLDTSSWSLEILSWLLAAVSLAVLIIVLASFRGKPLSQWHSGITPNTVLTMLTTLGATALIFPSLPLHQAAAAPDDAGRIDMLAFLIDEMKLDVDADDWAKGVFRRLGTPLHYAIQSGGIEKAKFLVKKGASLDIRNSRGRTPLEQAERTTCGELFELLRGMKD
ncbi:MAG: hypothetical protein M1835_003929, partial [Candelina submexicana]